MNDDQKQAVRDLLDSLAVLKDRFGHWFRDSDEWEDVVHCQKKLKAMVRVRKAKAPKNPDDTIVQRLRGAIELCEEGYDANLMREAADALENKGSKP